MKINLDDPKLTAYALNELEGAEKAEMETAVGSSPAAQEFVRELRALGGNLRAEYETELAADHEFAPPMVEENEDAPWNVSWRLAIAAVLVIGAVLGAMTIRTRPTGLLGSAAPAQITALPRSAAAPVKRAGAKVQSPIVEAFAPIESPLNGPDLADAPLSRTKDPAEPLPSGLEAEPRTDPLATSSLTLSGGLARKTDTGMVANTASYRHLVENSFLAAREHPLSTFSIDVDTASYVIVRRFLDQGALPPKDAVRIEEMINYFHYDYPQPNDDAPFSVNLDAASCPWAPAHRLVRIGLQGRKMPNEQRLASNLVFLLDVSGSMEPANRLPLVKQAMRLLVEKLGAHDRVAIVIYAGGSGLALPSTTGDQKERILTALENLRADGSTNGAQGIELAYRTAAEHFIKGGVNRVILATDGDFNVGTTSEGELVRLIEAKAKSGVFLSVLGVGENNLNDSMMQQLADKGNGNYAYLDSVDEARKVLVRQINGRLLTIAKDVKIQVEFNPAKVASYRLIGYEKRLLEKEDFNNDQIDAGEIGAGHTVTALYEVVPVGDEPNPAASVPPVDPLKYQPATPALAVLPKATSREMLTVKLRYKEPGGDTSKLIERPFVDPGTGFANAAPDLKFAAAVAEFGMILRGSDYKGNGSLGAVEEWARQGKGADENRYRAGFVALVKKAQTL